MRIRKKKGKRNYTKKLCVSLQGNGDILIDYNPESPPHVYFDTNVFLSLNDAKISWLKMLQSKRGFHYRWSMVNFVELASHLGDDVGINSNPFKRYQAALRRILCFCEPEPLPSPEYVLMKSVGLFHFLGKEWCVDDWESWHSTLTVISNAESLFELEETGIRVGHYKSLRVHDSKFFLEIMKRGKEIGGFPEAGKAFDPKLANVWKVLIDYLILRASRERKTFGALGAGEKKRVVKFFDPQNPGNLFLMHFIYVLQKTIMDGRTLDPNDFNDLLQLLLLKDENLIFVTSDKIYFQYCDRNLFEEGQVQRVIPWRAFSRSLENG